MLYFCTALCCIVYLSSIYQSIYLWGKKKPDPVLDLLKLLPLVPLFLLLPLFSTSDGAGLQLRGKKSCESGAEISSPLARSAAGLPSKRSRLLDAKGRALIGLFSSNRAQTQQEAYLLAAAAAKCCPHGRPTNRQLQHCGIHVYLFFSFGQML